MLLLEQSIRTYRCNFRAAQNVIVLGARIKLLNSLFQSKFRFYRDNDVHFIDDKNREFDLLIFTQVWPVTGCISWTERNPLNTCTLPSPKEIWTIHGVWPTRFGTIGPAFCNSSATFDIATLKPFEDQLKQFWINIENGKLWNSIGRNTRRERRKISSEFKILL